MAVPGGYAAFWLLARTMAACGASTALWAHAAGAPVFALVALASPLFAPLLPLLLPVRPCPRGTLLMNMDSAIMFRVVRFLQEEDGHIKVFCACAACSLTLQCGADT